MSIRNSTMMMTIVLHLTALVSLATASHRHNEFKVCIFASDGVERVENTPNGSAVSTFIAVLENSSRSVAVVRIARGRWE